MAAPQYTFRVPQSVERAMRLVRDLQVVQGCVSRHTTNFLLCGLKGRGMKFFTGLVGEIAERIRETPRVLSEYREDETVAHLHYRGGASRNWFVLATGDELRAGYAITFRDGAPESAELVPIDLGEITEEHGADLEFYFEPQTVSSLRDFYGLTDIRWVESFRSDVPAREENSDWWSAATGRSTSREEAEEGPEV